MKFSMYKFFFVAVFLLAAMTSCEVEFSPNAEWTEIPVVYCVLDQDDDTTYVRVQKCFMGEGDNNQYAQIFDSINYAEEDLVVRMVERLAYSDANNEMHPYDDPTQVFDFQYMLVTDKPEGHFSSPAQPVYFCPTAGQLDANHVYELYVLDARNGDTIATSSTALIGGRFRVSAGNGTFQFSGSEGNKTCLIKWDAMKRARQYQTMVRFYYRDFIVEPIPGGGYDTIIDRHYLDISGGTLKSNTTAATETYYFPQTRFLHQIQDALADNIVNRNIVDTVDVYVYSCSEDLAAYLHSSQDNGSLNQNEYNYTNIKGGLGVFGARRIHLYASFPTPPAGNSQYKKAIKELGVGF